MQDVLSLELLITPRTVTIHNWTGEPGKLASMLRQVAADLDEVAAAAEELKLLETQA